MENKQQKGEKVQKVNYGDRFTEDEKVVLVMAGVDPYNLTEDNILDIDDDVENLLFENGLQGTGEDYRPNHIGEICVDILNKIADISYEIDPV